MKIIHCADIHADSKMDTNLSKELALKRRVEVVDAFEKMVNFANTNDVKVIIIAGDLFDTKNTQQKKIKERISYIISQNPKIDFLYLKGNHDEDTDFIQNDNLQNLKLFSKDKWTCYSYENIDIWGREFSDTILQTSYAELNPQKDKINIVTLHGQIAEYTTKNDAPEISLPKLSDKNIDYLALGHIHEYRQEKLSSRGKWCYSGCLEGRGFDECGKKGFVLLEIQNNKITSEFIPNSIRTINNIQVELNGTLTYNEIMNSIQQKIESVSARDILQIELVGEVSEDTDIRVDSYADSINNNYFFVRIKDKTETIIDYKKYENDVSLKGEFIRLVRQQKDLSSEDKIKIIMNGIKALERRDC